MKYYDRLIFELSKKGRTAYTLPASGCPAAEIPAGLLRPQAPALPEVSEVDVARHYTALSQMNFGVDTGFYPLGSCTMKYNPKINEEIAAMPAFQGLHPLQDEATVQGALEVYYEMDKALAAITGMKHFTLNPCAGAHGELTGLMIMRSYHLHRGDTARTKVIVPDSAHGTNPASAAVCGLEIVEVKSGADGLVDVESLRPLLGPYIAGIMMTNPNTLGLFEKDIKEIAALVHECGGLLYYDGANMNPLLGTVRPGDMGFDIMHLNLHKTFSTPHGGGGPGSGPVGVAGRLVEFLPVPRVEKLSDGTAALYDGIKKLSGGTGDLTDGINKLLAGSLELKNGASDLDSGAKKVLLPITSAGSSEIAYIQIFDNITLTVLNPYCRLIRSMSSSACIIKCDFRRYFNTFFVKITSHNFYW